MAQQAEGRQVIPAEAVEAAAKIPYEAIVEASRAIDDDAYALIGWEGITRILEAAAPHMLGCHQSRGWVAKTRNTDGRVGIIGHFQDEVEAERWADKWNESTGRMSAFVERDTK